MGLGLTGLVGDDVFGLLVTSDYRALTSTMKKIGDGSVDSPFNASALWLGVDKIGINENVAITATSTQINYLVGVTSAIQTQLDAKALSSDLANYLTTSTAASTYLTQASAASIYQTALVSGTSIKTINSTSLLGSGDIAITPTTLGLVIGTNVQAYSANLTTYAGIAPSANVQTLLGAANYAAFKTSLSLNNVENTALTTWAGSTSITTLGTIATGTWNATAIGVTKGGTGLTTVAALSIVVSSTLNTFTTVTPSAGQSIRINAGGTAWEAYTPGSGGGTTFDDSTFAIYDNGDNTKIVAFQVSSVTTGTTRTLTVPDASGTIALTSDLSTYLTTSTASSTYFPLAGGTVTGATTLSGNGALSAPILTFTGTTITGGTATTTKPLILVETTGTNSTGWNTSGTYLGINVPSTFTTGYVIDFQLNGSTRASMRGRGDWVMSSDQARTLSVTSGGGSGTIYCDSTNTGTTATAGLIISNNRQSVGATLGTVRVGSSNSTVTRFGIANGERDRMMVITDGTNSNGLMIGTLNSNIAVFGTVDLESFRITTGQDISMTGAILTAASTTSKAGLRIPSGTAPSSPTSGDFWYDGSNLKFRNGATTQTLTWT